jgi:cell division protein DivIC
MQIKNHIPRWLRSKYTLVTLLFLLFILLLDNRNLISQYNRYKELRSLRTAASDLGARNRQLQRENEAIRSNPIEIERVAREKYYMKRKNETVFLFEDAKSGKK